MFHVATKCYLPWWSLRYPEHFQLRTFWRLFYSRSHVCTLWNARLSPLAVLLRKRGLPAMQTTVIAVLPAHTMDAACSYLRGQASTSCSEQSRSDHWRARMFVLSDIEYFKVWKSSAHNILSLHSLVAWNVVRRWSQWTSSSTVETIRVVRHRLFHTSWCYGNHPGMNGPMRLGCAG